VVSTLPTANGPEATGVFDLDSGAQCDECGDTMSSTTAFYTLELTVQCEPYDGTDPAKLNKLSLPYCTSWAVNAKDICTGPDDAFATSKSKCVCDDGFVIDINVAANLGSEPICYGGLNGHEFSASTEGAPLVSCVWTFTVGGQDYETSSTTCGSYDPISDLETLDLSRQIDITKVAVEFTDVDGLTGTQSITDRTFTYYEELTVTATLDEGCDAYSYSATASGGASLGYKFEWTLGPSGSSAMQSGTQGVPGDGSYSATVTVTDTKTDCFVSDTASVSVQAPVASFTVQEDPCSSIVMFDASGSTSGSQDIKSYAWVFGDGTNGANVMESHEYDPSSACSYSVSLTVTDELSCSSSVTTKSVPIGDIPMPDFVSQVPDPCSPVATFDASSSVNFCNGVLTYLWDFDGEGTSDGEMASFEFSTCGTKSVSLVVADQAGCTNSITNTVGNINKRPVASFTSTIDDCNLELGVDASGSDDGCGTGAPASFTWDFGDDTIVTSASATEEHTYTDCGEYTITLSVEDSFGCTSSVDATDAIYANKGPEAQALSVVPQDCFGALFTPKVVDCDSEKTSASYDENLSCKFKSDVGAIEDTKDCISDVNHTYDTCGQYTASYTVTDNKGCTATIDRTLTFTSQLTLG